MPIQSITTFTLLGFPAKNRYWAFRHMGSAPFQLRKIEGLIFFKLLGAGNGQGFSIRPDFGRYGVLAVWESREAKDNFFRSNEVYQEYRHKSFEVWTATLIPLSAHGLWSKVNPFESQKNYRDPAKFPIAILTRASIRTSKLWRFWKHVPATSEAITNAEGLIASIGMGEWPVVRQATLSFWENMQFAKKFAYQDKIHTEVVKKTRSESWYKEELFARFMVIEAVGTWNGIEPLFYKNG